MKTLPKIWTYSEQFKKHIITPGPFHIEMNFICMLTGKRMQGSGYKEILEEAKLVTKGCLKSIFNRKAFAKAFFNLKAFNEASERLLIEVFSEMENVENEPNSLLLLVRKPAKYK